MLCPAWVIPQGLPSSSSSQTWGAGDPIASFMGCHWLLLSHVPGSRSTSTSSTATLLLTCSSSPVLLRTWNLTAAWAAGVGLGLPPQLQVLDKEDLPLLQLLHWQWQHLYLQLGVCAVTCCSSTRTCSH
jgi:hypothetical protein